MIAFCMTAWLLQKYAYRLNQAIFSSVKYDYEEGIVLHVYVPSTITA